MRTPLNSIKKLTDLVIDTKILTEKVFTQIGAVEEIIDLNKKYNNIVVAKIISKEIHPDSEKLAVYMIDAGIGSNIQVVAGDRTLEISDTVAYFKPGAVIPYNASPEKNENVVSKVTLRGVESEGMMASQRELDLGSDHTKIMRLDSSLVAGASISSALGLDDLVLDIENKALANRGDCFGLIGLAREISAIQGNTFVSPNWYIDAESNKPKIEKKVELKITNQTQLNCPRYIGFVMDSVKVDESPTWLQVELAKQGIKSINNVVDITNYLMTLTSQPMHAFDYDKVLSKQNGSDVEIVVRQAINGEKLLALNDKVVELDDSMTVICDSQNPIAVAGIIGGKDTEIDENTKRVIIEVANFNRYNIRKTSWKLGIFTDAATRFTKALSPEQCLPVAYQAAKLMEELAGAKVVSEFVDSYPNPKEPITLTLDIQTLNKTIGLNLTIDEVEEILNRVEYTVEKKSDDTLEVSVPFFREDVHIVEDIYEDVARIYGFNSVPVTLPTKSITPAKSNHILDIKENIRRVLSNNGANEILTYNFVSSEEITKYNIDIENAHELKNPLSPELAFMRVNLAPSIAVKMKENLGRGYNVQTLFELNVGHNKLEKDNENLPLERWNLTLLSTQNSNENTSAYYNSKVYIDLLEKKLSLVRLQYTLLADINKEDLPIWISLVMNMYNSNRSAVIWFEQEGKKYYLGIIGQYSNQVIYANNLPKDISGFEIDIVQLQNAINPVSRYQEPSRYPKITQDLCFSFDSDIQYNAIREEIEDSLKKSKMYYELELLDIYSPENDTHSKQMTFRISLQSRDKTLESHEFDIQKKKIVFLLNEKFNAKLV